MAKKQQAKELEEKEVLIAENDIKKESDVEKKEPTPEEKYAELNDRFLRLYAEFENFRRRTNKEHLELISTANASLLRELLPILDDFERAIANNETSEDTAVLKEGFAIIYNKYKGILESKGVKPIIAKGEPFNSDVHEAIVNVPVEDENQKGKVIEDIEKGYSLNEKVIRFSKVVVGQ
jgi:molecular chaperone GrpE